MTEPLSHPLRPVAAHLAPAVWQPDALCRQVFVLRLLGLVAVVDVGTSPWFSAKGHPAAHAKRVCNSCPVKADCLSWAMVTGQVYGVWGGAGGSLLRGLRNLLATSPHPDAGVKPRCRCAVCREARSHFRRLDVFARRGRYVDPYVAGPRRTFGAGATHGRRSTYARGCRCEKCRAAIRRPAPDGHPSRRTGGEAA